MAEPSRTSTPRSDLERLAWPPIEAGVIQLFAEAGEKRELVAGETVFEVGGDSYDFMYIEKGSIEIIDRADDRSVVRIEAGNFVGELGMLMGQKNFLAGVASEDSSVIVISQKKISEMVAMVPEIGDLVVTAFAARRRLLMEWGEGGLVIVGEDTDPRTQRLLEFAGRNLIPHRWVDRNDPAAIGELAATIELPAEGPIAILGRAEVLVDPSRRDLATAMGLDLLADTTETFDVAVIGAGPGGLAAAVYAASEGLRALVIEDTAIGGQAGTSSRIENYLGFPKGVSGADLAYLGEVQAIKFGARIAFPRRATKLERNEQGFSLTLDDDRRVNARSVILASGVQYRRLPLDRIEDFEGRGIYYAATDLEARKCHDTEAVIVGGGNSAGQAAMFLSRYASCTHIVVRRDGLSETMSSYLTERIARDERIKLWTNSEVSKLHGADRLEAVTIRNNETGELADVPSQALFFMIGAAPNTGWLDGLVDLDEKGFILTGRSAGAESDGYATSCPGVFAVGDIRAGSVKRVASAVGEGSVVVSAVHSYLQEQVGT